MSHITPVFDLDSKKKKKGIPHKHIKYVCSASLQSTSNFAHVYGMGVEIV